MELVMMCKYYVREQFKDNLHDFHCCISYARNANCLKYARLALALKKTWFSRSFLNPEQSFQAKSSAMQTILYGDFQFNPTQCSVMQSGEVKHSL